MSTIFDIVNAKNIASYLAENPSNSVPYFGATLFPAKKQLGLDLSWIKGANGLPVALMPSEFDAKATVRDRIGLDKIQTEMPFFRESMRVGEKDRQELNRLLTSSIQGAESAIVQNIYDDVSNLVKGAEVQPERMIMQLLASGKIAIRANRQNFDYDYKMKEDHKETLLTDARWSQKDSTPIQDILRWQDEVENNTGSRPTNAILTRKTWGYLLNHASIRLDLNPLGGQNIIMTDTLLKQYLQTKFGLSVAVYNKKYRDEKGALQNFFPDDHFTLFPDGQLGSTMYGTTPEESDLLTGSSSADVQIVNTGVAVTTIKEEHPVNVMTVVSEIVLPSFETLDNIFAAKVN